MLEAEAGKSNAVENEDTKLPSDTIFYSTDFDADAQFKGLPCEILVQRNSTDNRTFPASSRRKKAGTWGIDLSL